MNKRILQVASAVLLSITPFSVMGATSFDSISFKPATDHGFYLTTQQSQTLKQWGFAVGLMGELSNDSLVLENASGAVVRKIIEDQVALQLGAALGLLNWLNAGVLVSGIPFQEFNDVATGAEDDGGRFGDIRFDLKARLLDNEKFPVGIALVPFITFPTGSDEHFVGNGKITGGGLFVLDSKRIADRVSLALNAGAQFRDEVTITPVTTIGHQFLYSAGINIGIIKALQLVGDISGWTPFDNFFEDNNRNLEVNGALKILPTKRVIVTVGGGTGLEDGAGAPDWRVFTGLAYRHPREEAPPPPPPPPAEPQEEVISTNKIHFQFNKAVLLPASFPVIDEILAGINGRDDIEGIRVEGHTDSVGSDAYNQTLSEKRAGAVRQYMIDKGYPAEKITSVGMGESQPIADNQTKAGRAENRRVEFHLILKPGAKVKVIKDKDSPTYEEGDPIKNNK